MSYTKKPFSPKIQRREDLVELYHSNLLSYTSPNEASGNTLILNRKIEHLQNELEELTKYLADETKENVALEELLQENSFLRRELETVRSVREQERLSMLEKTRVIEEQVKKGQDTVQLLKKQLDQCNAHIAALNSCHPQGNNDWEEEKRRMNEERQRMDGEIQRMNEERQRMNEERQRMNEEIQKLLLKVHQLTGEFGDEQGAKEEVMEQLNQQSLQMEQLRRENLQMEQLKGEILNLQRSNSELLEQNGYLRQEIDQVGEIALDTQKQLQNKYLAEAAAREQQSKQQAIAAKTIRASLEDQLRQLQARYQLYDAQLTQHQQVKTGCKQIEQKLKQTEEKLRVSDGKLKRCQDMGRISQDKCRKSEDMLRNSEQRVRFMEQNCRVMNDRLKESEQKRRGVEAKAKASEDSCRVIQEKLGLIDQECRTIQRKLQISQSRLTASETSNKVTQDQFRLIQQRCIASEQKARTAHQQLRSCEEERNTVELSLRGCQLRCRELEQNISVLSGQLQSKQKMGQMELSMATLGKQKDIIIDQLRDSMKCYEARVVSLEQRLKEDGKKDKEQLRRRGQEIEHLRGQIGLLQKRIEEQENYEQILRTKLDDRREITENSEMNKSRKQGMLSGRDYPEDSYITQYNTESLKRYNQLALQLNQYILTNASLSSEVSSLSSEVSSLKSQKQQLQTQLQVQLDTLGSIKGETQKRQNQRNEREKERQKERDRTEHSLRDSLRTLTAELQYARDFISKQKLEGNTHKESLFILQKEMSEQRRIVEEQRRIVEEQKKMLGEWAVRQERQLGRERQLEAELQRAYEGMRLKQSGYLSIIGDLKRCEQDMITMERIKFESDREWQRRRNGLQDEVAQLKIQNNYHKATIQQLYTQQHIPRDTPPPPNTEMKEEIASLKRKIERGQEEWQQLGGLVETLLVKHSITPRGSGVDRACKLLSSMSDENMEMQRQIVRIKGEKLEITEKLNVVMTNSNMVESERDRLKIDIKLLKEKISIFKTVTSQSIYQEDQRYRGRPNSREKWDDDRHNDRHNDRYNDRHNDRHNDRQNDRHNDRQNDRQNELRRDEKWDRKGDRKWEDSRGRSSDRSEKRRQTAKEVDRVRQERRGVLQKLKRQISAS